MKIMNDLFILEGMKESVVLAGHRGLTRNVQFVNISDTPDVIQFLDRNHLLLTTGYAFNNNIQLMCELIKQMHELNCSGMVIKINRFLQELPTEVKLLADDLAFPIIDLPTKHTLGEVSRYILNYLNDHEAEQLYYALHVQKEFSDMMIKGYSLTALIEQLGHFLSRPTLLLNHRGEKIAHSHDFRMDSMKLVEQEIIEKVKEDLAAAREGSTFVIPSKEQQSISTFPVQTKRQHPSMLVIIDSLTLPYPSSQMAIEQAGNVISFTIIKEQAIEENSRLLKNNFFDDLIEKRIHSDEEILSRANYYGLNEDLNNICIICTVDQEGQNYEALQLYEKKVGELHNTIYDQLEDEIIHSNMEGILFTKEKYFVMILQFENFSDEDLYVVTEFIKNCQEGLQGDYSISFGISNAVNSIKDITTAYNEAVEAIMSGYDMNKLGFINFYKTKELEELLNAIPKKDLKALYENTLKSLAYPKTKEDQELIKTIQVFLDSQCEISETSRRLYIHRNTVKYRIEKTEELLNCSLRDPVDSLRIRVALMIGTILKEIE
ncbi:PucR family transcriptional regulator ligand-binding domain-containing protein [Bacillus sp. DTU_2020_1000418_1_SI_GHA_SEK_038]|uniref:PucR family transcriptional regulator n=1 Tax=Bacillus sp. DTU_2020_1000418_1_SI_GHA_SEK_038 TaxID=3077585 RepID=UPI0028E25787|nr:PucR family transcriptional regulator ligand-binding domain-containing protein [Bacillus sp. DTU_2020_1000418_1_SI_GHA_SEK_038]WNS76913.1 PucR family transcriptional regulator ligand-binding domain-containing protein [Bacillus sp. DTU_2020_1000418_1_SI_GHA_SEK_038]